MVPLLVPVDLSAREMVMFSTLTSLVYGVYARRTDGMTDPQRHVGMPIKSIFRHKINHNFYEPTESSLPLCVCPTPFQSPGTWPTTMLLRWAIDDPFRGTNRQHTRQINKISPSHRVSFYSITMLDLLLLFLRTVILALGDASGTTTSQLVVGKHSLALIHVSQHLADPLPQDHDRFLREQRQKATQLLGGRPQVHPVEELAHVLSLEPT